MQSLEIWTTRLICIKSAPHPGLLSTELGDILHLSPHPPYGDQPPP